jgi:ketosteroid isomerase-like protein
VSLAWLLSRPAVASAIIGAETADELHANTTAADVTLMEAKDFDRLGSYYADDISLTFANAPTITGRDAVLAQMTTLLGQVTSLAHPLLSVWQEDGPG